MVLFRCRCGGCADGKPEPFKLWLAKVGKERLNQRLKNIEVHKELEKETGKKAISNLNAKTGILVRR